jgi:hypothetical protein
MCAHLDVSNEMPFLVLGLHVAPVEADDPVHSHHLHAQAQHSTAQHSTAQHSTAQHGPLEDSTAHQSGAQERVTLRSPNELKVIPAHAGGRIGLSGQAGRNTWEGAMGSGEGPRWDMTRLGQGGGVVMAMQRVPPTIPKG